MKTSRIIPLLSILILVGLACALPGLGGAESTDTVVPTITNEPVNTVEPTATVPPQPTEQQVSQEAVSTEASTEQEDIAVIADASYRVDTWDYIVGIVQNNTEDTIEWLELSILIYDDSETLIATESVYPFLDKIAPGETTPFSVSSDEWAEGSSYEFLVEDYEVAEEPIAEGIEILSHTSYSDEYDLNLVGEVQNNSDKPMSFLKVAAAVYAADGTLLNTNYSYVMLNYLHPGEKSPFKIWFSDNWEDGDTYEIEVQGDYDETAPATTVQVVDFNDTVEDGICTVTGNAKNTGTTELTYGTVVAAFYDSNDQLVDAEWSFTEGDTFPAGATAAFTITSFSCPEYDHVEVLAGN